MSSKPQQKAIQFRALVKNQVMVILVDSDSLHTFVNSGIVNRLQVLATPTQPMTVKVANGDTLLCSSKIKNFEWWC
jgi:hypothetical protein